VQVGTLGVGIDGGCRSQQTWQISTFYLIDCFGMSETQRMSTPSASEGIQDATAFVARSKGRLERETIVFVVRSSFAAKVFFFVREAD